MNLLTQEHTLGTHGLADEHIWVCKWCMADVRLYLQLKPICKWLREKVEDKMVELIIQFCGHQLSVGQTLITHHDERFSIPAFSFNQFRFPLEYKDANGVLSCQTYSTAALGNTFYLPSQI